MSREIKFRAWGKNIKEYMSQTFDGVTEIANVTDILGDLIEQGTWVIEQFTGLRDKNGKEIYEGDIVTLKYEYYQDDKKGERMIVPVRKACEVVIDENGVGFMQYIAELCKPITYWHRYKIKEAMIAIPNPNAEVEIVGNIHEDPELLESKK